MDNCLEGLTSAIVRTKNGLKKKFKTTCLRQKDIELPINFDQLETASDSQLELSDAEEGRVQSVQNKSSIQQISSSSLSAIFNGQQFLLSLTDSSIEMTADSNVASKSILQSVPLSYLPFVSKSYPAAITIPLDEVLSASYEAVSLDCFRGLSKTLIISTIRRSEKGDFRGEWVPYDICLEQISKSDGKDLEKRINSRLEGFSERPRKLLVFVNPFGGSKHARKTYQTIVEPIFNKCKICIKLIETKHQNNAQETLNKMDANELSDYDGIVGVGGDGLFQEILNGILFRKDSDRFIIEKRIRVAQIPGGSTDCLAYSVNGTRSPAASALHIVLGDRMPLDVMRIRNFNQKGDTTGMKKHVVCLAAYGFLGDVMRRSEFLRFLGQKRYDVAGLVTYLTCSSYKVKIEYIPFQQKSKHHHRQKSRCHSQCQICSTSSQQAIDIPKTQQQQQQQIKTQSQEGNQLNLRSTELELATHADSDPNHPSSSSSDMLALGSGQIEGNMQGEWQVTEGDYKMVLCAVTSCISDRSRTGLVPFAHTSDGRMHLILVPRMNAVRFLWFLSSMGRRGIDEEAFKCVQRIDVRAFRMTPIGNESSWNVDGELMTSNQVEGEIVQGLVDVFSRGIEIKASKEKRV